MMDKESVRHQLRSVFPNDPRVPRLTHEECVEMRPRLIALRIELFPAYLRQVMEDLLDHPGANPGKPEYAEAVVEFMNVRCERPLHHFNQNKVDLVDSRETTVSLRRAREYSFESITSDQAKAICSWLELARSWPTLEWNLDSLEAALRYWKDRAINS